MKRLSAIFMIALLLFTAVPFSTLASGTMSTDLKDGLVTKSDRLTFDLWAKDAYGQKIDGSTIEVLNNGVTIPINWDDTEKTSYTLNLELGENEVSIKAGQNSLKYTITREFANDGDTIGTFTFSLDAFTIGLGYIIEPIQVPIIKGENAAEQLDRLLRNHYLSYKSTGTLKNGFYLSSIQNNDLYDKPVNIPQILKEKLNGTYNEQDYSVNTGLGEFDFNHMSGWMYSVNNIFPNVGFADKYMLDGDVMRVQFTLAYGQDIGGGGAMGDNLGQDYFPKVNRDALTKQLAMIHQSGKDNFLINAARIQAYKHALTIMATFNTSQQQLDQALAQLQAAQSQTVNDGTKYEEHTTTPVTPPTISDAEKEARLAANRVISQISVLPGVGNLTLNDAFAVQLARTAFSNLTAQAQNYVTNVSKLVSLEQRIIVLQTTETPYPTQPVSGAERVMAQIQALPATVTVKDQVNIVAARKAYDALSEVEKLTIVNYSYLLLAEMYLLQLQEQTDMSTEKVKRVTTFIERLPKGITLDDAALVQEARTLFNSLQATEKEAVKNSEILVQAEATLQKLIQAANNEVNSLQKFIEQLPKDFQKLDHSIVEKLYASYETLTKEQQLLVENRDILLKAWTFLNPENEFKIDDQTAVFYDNSLSGAFTIDAKTLQTIYDNKKVSSMIIERTDGTKLTVNKALLQSVASKQDVEFEIQVVTIGQQKQLTVSLQAKEAITIPVKLELPAASWSNGYLLKDTDTGFTATPHIHQDDYLVATVESGQAYSYTTKSIVFNDVKTNVEDITYLANRHVIQGANGLFNPGNSITRAQFAAMIARAMAAKPSETTKFTDIKGQWYEENVQALYELGIITGEGDSFKPKDQLSRQHAAIMMARILRQAGIEQPDTFKLTYKDSAQIQKKYAADIAWLQELGIMSGANNTFSPQAPLTRAQMAKILRKTLSQAKIM